MGGEVPVKVAVVVSALVAVGGTWARTGAIGVPPVTLSIFLPCRKGSERIPRKNTRMFAGVGGGLLRIKLEQLLRVEAADEIVLSTNDGEAMAIAADYADAVRVMTRPESLCRADTPLCELIEHAGDICSGENILWTHVTSPLFDRYNEVVEEKKRHSHSMMATHRYHPRTLATGDRQRRSQDLDPVTTVTSAFFFHTAEAMRTGSRESDFSVQFMTTALEAIDIDTEDDWALAEAAYRGRK